ncbi:angiopoietin-related protein 2 [Callorhinchus milii]|uniref:Angiopoietin-like 2b n=1 Tax=Callorhinchus milii TaxID=7868 RepID=A0A4W3IGE1_CALMI|nr:angiopoietin-related protein 2 [Callorhinchus milii]|eukprot:gi/632986513/ref/XP_007910281.1/ PREDICTED: angiopoietin-related protein 2 [Callorhinchus milii]
MNGLILLMLMALFDLVVGVGVRAAMGEGKEQPGHAPAHAPEEEEPKLVYGDARHRRATGAQDGQCSYTFIVPQQRVTGAICVNSKPESVAGSLVESRVNKQEMEVVTSELLKQKRQIEILQQLVEVDGGVVNEVKLLRKESRNMNSRVTQLYMQLLHEIIRKRDNALEVSQLENRILNQTSEMMRLSNRYKDLEHKYQHLVSLANNQSSLIARLEERCQLLPAAHPVQPPPPPPKHPVHQITTNEIQRDQNHQERPQLVQNLPAFPSNVPITSTPSGPWTDCLEALEGGQEANGIYLLKPENTNRLMQVWCDQRHDPGGWTVIQRRQDGSVNFFRNWETYKQGFGNIDGEYWLGLENIYWLTSQGNYKLLITMEDWQGRKVFAEYASFRLEPENDYYKLRVGRYHGNAGDSFTWHNGKQFTTLDRDRDAYTGNCAHYQKGGWWYNACAHSNLNGVWYRGGHYRSKYQDGVYWAEFRGGAYSLKSVVMMIRPNPNTFH